MALRQRTNSLQSAGEPSKLDGSALQAADNGEDCREERMAFRP